MASSDVIVTRSRLETILKNKILHIIGVKIPINSLFDVIQILVENLKQSNNTQISVIIQNHQSIILISNTSNKAIEAQTKSKSHEIKALITKLPGIEILTGYGIHSLLHEGFVKINRNYCLTFNKLHQKTYWKPYKISNLQVDSSTFTKMLELFSNHRLILSLNPRKGLTDLQLTLIIVSSSIEELHVSTKHITTSLLNFTALHGELETYQKKELKKSLLQILLGINNPMIKSSPIIGYFKDLSFPQSNEPIVYQSSMPLQYLENNQNFLPESTLNGSNIAKQISSSTQLPKNFDTSIDVIEQLKSWGWVLDDKKFQKISTALVFSNFMVHLVIVKNPDTMFIFDRFQTPGLYLIFRLSGKKLKYVKSTMKV